jgi:hypoxanthine phosphoribosyltransferase
MHEDIETVLFSTEQILGGIVRVADELTRDYAGEVFTVVGVLKGSVVFVSDLVRNIPAKLEMAFVGASSYGAGTTSGNLKLNFFPMEEEIRGRRILLVDDILDTGRTMAALQKEMYARGAVEVKTCVFLDKPSRRSVELEADYACFEVEDLFVVGYGLDFAGRYRNLPYVGALKPALYQTPEEQAPAEERGGKESAPEEASCSTQA